MRTSDEKLMESVYEEGLISRFKARRAGQESMKQMGITPGMQLSNKVANKLGFQSSSSSVRKKMSKASATRASAQINTLVAEYLPKLQKLSDKFNKDITKLNVDPSMIKDAKARKILVALMEYATD